MLYEVITYFQPPHRIDQTEMDARMDEGIDTFALDIPPGFQRDSYNFV